MSIGWGLQNAPGPCPYRGITGGSVCMDIANPARHLMEVTTTSDPLNPGLGIATFTLSVPPAPPDTQVYLQAMSVRNPVDAAKSNVLPTSVNPSSGGPAGPTRRVGVGCGHTCWIDNGGDLNCVDDLLGANVPAFLPGPWVDLTADCYDTCVRDPSGQSTCFDFNGSNVVPGNPTMVDAGYASRVHLEQNGTMNEVGNGPEPVPSGSDWVTVSSGYVHACAIDGNADLFCWSNTGNTTPVPPTQGVWVSVSTGSFSTCAIDTSDNLVCFGDDPHIVDLAPTTDSWSEVKVGYDVACALDLAGAVTCWGNTPNIQVNIPTGSGLSELALTWSHACAMNAAGEPVCWGLNNTGGLPPGVP